MIKSLKNSSDLYYLVGVIILSVSIHIFSLIASRTFLSSWSLVHYPLHTALEIGGSFIAFLVASSLIVLEKNGRGTSYNYIIAMALLGMGIFDGFHSFVHAGKEFVLLHSMATLWGGSLFVLIFLPRPLRTKIKLSWCMGIGLVSVALCLLVISKPHIFPNMLRNGQFTMWAKALNIMGGIFLILTSMKFILYFVKKRNFDDFLFFLHTLLFGLAAVMFEQSQLWDAAWWGWHFLRFFAYAVAAWFVIKSVKASMREIADKELERSLILENNFFLKTILDSFEDFVFVFDQNNQYSFCSNSVVETLGYDLKKFSNKNMEEVKDIVLKSHKKKTNVLEAAIEEFYMVNLKGENVPISISIKDLTNSKRKEIGKILIFKNLIKLKLRENLINLQKEKIINSSKLASLGEMAGGIAHEINNPLTIISSSTYVLKKIIKKGKLSEDSVNKVISDIETTVNRISKIINGLKTVSRDSSGFSLEKTTLGEIFSDVLGLCSERFKNNDTRLEVNTDSKEFKTVFKCDRVQLSQVLLNMLGNAYDAVEDLDERWVKIELTESDDFFTLAITDSGHGISEEVRKRIFNPFFTTKITGKGTGLGLSISKTIIEKHGGSLEIDRGCQNTCFIITLSKKLSKDSLDVD